jgi:dihydrofolate reductase
MPIKFKLIAAVCSDGGMGYKGRLPWPHNKADMAQFAKRTTGAGNNAIIMGAKTWDSIPARPLRNRANLILSSHEPHEINNRAERWFKTIPELLAHLEAAEYDEVWIIGGARIYEQFLAMHTTGEIHIDEMCVTTMEGTYACDTFFPHSMIGTTSSENPNPTTN